MGDGDSMFLGTEELILYINAVYPDWVCSLLIGIQLGLVVGSGELRPDLIQIMLNECKYCPRELLPDARGSEIIFLVPQSRLERGRCEIYAQNYCLLKYCLKVKILVRADSRLPNSYVSFVALRGRVTRHGPYSTS